jgi:hypothetical protein
MENWRSPLASITPFSLSQFGTISPNALAGVERAAAETATGFKEENTLGGPRTRPRVDGKIKLATEEIVK